MSDPGECYAGSSYPERPRAFVWGGQRYEVQEIIHRRREPEGVEFVVRSLSPEMIFDLFYNIETDQWQIKTAGSIMIEEQPEHKPTSQGD